MLKCMNCFQERLLRHFFITFYSNFALGCICMVVASVLFLACVIYTFAPQLFNQLSKLKCQTPEDQSTEESRCMSIERRSGGPVCGPREGSRNWAGSRPMDVTDKGDSADNLIERHQTILIIFYCSGSKTGDDRMSRLIYYAMYLPLGFLDERMSTH